MKLRARRRTPRVRGGGYGRGSTGAVRIEGVQAGRGNRYTTDIGEHTLIRRFTTNEPDDGYSYSIEEGAEFVIPVGTLIE